MVCVTAEFRVSVFLFALLWGCVVSQSPHRRFEYKYSFKAPYLAQKDNQVPFWSYSGNAIASAESMRITPSLRSQKGQAWSKLATTFEWWEAEIVFRINGRGRVGADGLAFWYTTTQGVEGPVFGSSDKWNGLGLFFDSFDNDNKRNNPYVMAMVNDGTLAYDHENDGASQMLGGCLRDFRNKPHPVRAKIEYYKNSLTVKLQNINLDMVDPNDAAPPLYNLYHHDHSSMGARGNFLSNFASHNHSASRDSEHHDGHSFSLFGSWFADAQEIDVQYDVSHSNYGDQSSDLENDTENANSVDSNQQGDGPLFSDPSLYGDGYYQEGAATASMATNDEVAAGVEGGEPGIAGDGRPAADGWTSFFEGPPADTTTPDTVTVSSNTTASVSSLEKLKLAKLKRKEKRKIMKERRKMARKFRRLGQKKSTVMVHNGLTASDKDYEICTRVENVVLPPNGYFGLSAATGGLADDHDVLKFLVTSLRGADELPLLESNREQDEQFQREFREYQEKTKKAREDYVAANPNATPHHGEDDDEFEAGETRELRQIFQGQSQIYDVIRQLNAKMDEIIGRQERTLSLVGAVHSSMAAGGGVPLPAASVSSVPLAPSVGGGQISRFEVDSIMNTQREIAQTARDVKSVVLDINQKSTQIINNNNKPMGSAQPVGGSYDMHVTLKELNEGLNHIKHTLGTSPQTGSTVIPPCPTCLPTWLFVSVAATQFVLIVGYMLYRDQKEAQAKKFY